MLALLGPLAGCAGILGIPSDVDRETSLASAEGGALDGTVVNEAEPAGDAGEDTDAPMESGPVEPPCDVAKAFGTPVALQGVNTPEDEGSPHLSEDELTLHVDALRAARGPSYGIYFTTRSTMTGAFGPLQTFPSVDNSINTSDDNTDGNVTADGKALFFERQNRAKGDSDLYTATRNATGDPFGTATSIANLNTANFEAEVFIRDDPSELWHVRNVNNSIDIALATLVSGTGYVVEPPPGKLVNVNQATSFEGYPVISKNGLALYFASDRPAPAPLADLNIYVATRASRIDAFNAPVLVENVNTAVRDYPGFISADGCRLYLSSTRTPGQGGQDLYVATRPK